MFLLVKDMERYRIPEDLKELYESIRNASAIYDYGEIAALARKGCDMT